MTLSMAAKAPERTLAVTCPDPLDEDSPFDEKVVTTRRGICRLALVATEVGGHFQREGVAHDPMTWMLSPRALFAGESAIDACLDRDACLRGLLLHGLSLGLDASPDAIDALTQADDDFDQEEEIDFGGVRFERHDHDGGGDDRARRRESDVPATGRSGRERGPRLFTATVVANDGLETIHAFHASFAMDEAEIAGRLYMRMGAACADAAIVRGFDHTSPIVEALVSPALCDTLMMVEAEPGSPLGAGLDLNVEQRFFG